jgi:hypothetical protein
VNADALLQGLKRRYLAHTAHSAFLTLLLGWGITLISSEEVADSAQGAATPEEARQFLDSSREELEAAGAAPAQLAATADQAGLSAAEQQNGGARDADLDEMD